MPGAHNLNALELLEGDLRAVRICAESCEDLSRKHLRRREEWPGTWETLPPVWRAVGARVVRSLRLLADEVDGVGPEWDEIAARLRGIAGAYRPLYSDLPLRECLDKLTALITDTNSETLRRKLVRVAREKGDDLTTR